MLLPDGSSLRVDDRPLAAALDVTDRAIDRTIAQLQSRIDQAERAVRLRIDPAAADATLRDLVGEHRVRTAPQTILDLLLGAVGRFLAGLGGAPPDGAVVLRVVGGLGVAALLVILGLLGRGLPERFRRETLLPELRVQRAADPAAHLRGADAALAAGRWRDAIHSLYLYALHALAARELLRYDPALTDRELLRRAAGAPGADALRELVALHERVWFGLREAAADEARRARELALRTAA